MDRHFWTVTSSILASPLFSAFDSTGSTANGDSDRKGKNFEYFPCNCVMQIALACEEGTMSDPATLAAIAAHKRVFPLRLSPIELFMIADDQVGYPMSFFIQLQFYGQIERGAFEGALDEALNRHPLLRAWIETGRGGFPFWVSAKGQLPDGDWGSEETIITCRHSEAIDLGREIGLRVWVRQGLQRAKVLLQFHHACCDGTGAYRFIGDLLAGYGIRTTTSGQRPSFGAVEPKLLRTRKHRPLERLRIAWTARPQMAGHQGVLEDIGSAAGAARAACHCSLAPCGGLSRLLILFVRPGRTSAIAGCCQ